MMEIIDKIISRATEVYCKDITERKFGQLGD